MKKSERFALGAALVLAATMFLGCPNPSGNGNPAADKTLAEQVVDELGASLSSSNSSSLRAVSAASVTAIKKAALERIAEDQLSDSTELDRLLPSMIEGVNDAVSADATLTASAATIFNTTAESALGSLGKSGRTSLLSTGNTIDAAVGKIAAAAVKVVVETVPAAEADEAISAVAATTVQVVSTNTLYATVVTAALSSAVTESVKVMNQSASVSDGTDTTKVSMSAAVDAMVSASIAAAASASVSADGNAVDLSAVLTSVNGSMAAVTVTKISTVEIVSITVGSSVSAAVSSGGDDASALVRDTMAAALSGVGSSNADSSALIAAAVQATTSAVAGSGATSADISLLIIEASKQAAATAIENEVPVTAEDISGAVNAGDPTIGAAIGTDLADAVETVQSETVPGISSVTATPESVTEIDTEVTLSVAAAAGTGTGLAYSWIQESGPAVTVSGAGTATAKFTPTASGNYTFIVTVRNAEGYLSANGSVTVTVKLASALSKTLLAEGIAALEEKNFDTAFTKFNASYAEDNSNIDAAFWAALMNMAGISTDSQTVALMKDRIGLASYPSNMNDLFSDKWFNAAYYDSTWGLVPAGENEDYVYTRGNVTPSTGSMSYICGYDEYGNWQNLGGIFVPAANGTFYIASSFSVGGTVYNAWDNHYPDASLLYTDGRLIDLADPVVLPALQTPSWATTIYGASGVYGDSAETTSKDTYLALLAANVIGRNPDGLNAMIDGILGGVYGSRLTQAVKLIDSLPDNASITVPAELLAAYSGQATVPEAGVTIHMAELKALSASVQISKSFVQLIASYNLNYPLAFLQNELWTDDGQDTALASLLRQNNPVKAGFLANRSQTTRNAAKNTLIDALADLDDALALFMDEYQDAGTLSSMVPGTMDPAEFEYALAQLSSVRSLIAGFSSAVADGSPLYINPEAMNSGSLSALLSTTGSASAIRCTPSVLYSTDIFNPAKLFEVTGTAAAPEGIKLYGLTSDAQGTDLVYEQLVKPADITTAKSYYALAVNLNMDRVNELVAVPDALFASGGMTASDLGFYVTLAGGSEKMLDETEWSLIDWIQ